MPDALDYLIPCPPVQEVFSADKTEEHREWVRRAVEAPFHFPGLLPNVKPAKVHKGTAPVQRSLFELCGDPANIQPHIVRSVQPKAVEPTVQVVMSAPECLRIAGIRNTHQGLRADDYPPMPRSLAYPVHLIAVGDSYELILSTPACSNLDFVRRVEEITGLQARWAPIRSRGKSAQGQWHHAVDLATDEGWEQLAASMEHTTPKLVLKGVGFGIKYGRLSADNGRRLLCAVGVPEPKNRALSKIKPNRCGRLPLSFDGWEAVHAVEDDLIIPANPSKQTFARATNAGWRSIGKKPPAFLGKPLKTERRLPPSDRLTTLIDAAGVGRRAGAKQIAYVEAAVRECLPANVPTFAKKIISVREGDGKVVARIRLFDDQIGVLTLIGKPSAHTYGWDATLFDERPFHYNHELEKWARFDWPVA